MTRITPVSTSQAPDAIGPYSQAVKAGGLLYTSGQIALTPGGDLLDGTIEEQTRQVFANLQAVLEAAGCQKTDVVKCTVYLKNMGEFVPMNGIYAEFFGDHKPARSTVEAAALPKNVKVEIDMIALLP